LPTVVKLPGFEDFTYEIIYVICRLKPFQSLFVAAGLENHSDRRKKLNPQGRGFAFNSKWVSIHANDIDIMGTNAASVLQ
jgi:hypothetical protein